jgi:hypothetical protein
LNVGDNWNISPTTFNQLRLTYVRNFGGRINSPAKSLADFGSKFQVQGEPALPQIQVSGFFTLGQAIAGPIAGSNYYGLRDLFNWNKGDFQPFSARQTFNGEMAVMAAYGRKRVFAATLIGHEVCVLKAGVSCPYRGGV